MPWQLDSLSTSDESRFVPHTSEVVDKADERANDQGENHSNNWTAVVVNTSQGPSGSTICSTPENSLRACPTKIRGGIPSLHSNNSNKTVCIGCVDGAASEEGESSSIISCASSLTKFELLDLDYEGDKEDISVEEHRNAEGQGLVGNDDIAETLANLSVSSTLPSLSGGDEDRIPTLIVNKQLQPRTSPQPDETNAHQPIGIDRVSIRSSANLQVLNLNSKYTTMDKDEPAPDTSMSLTNMTKSVAGSREILQTGASIEERICDLVKIIASGIAGYFLFVLSSFLAVVMATSGRSKRMLRCDVAKETTTHNTNEIIKLSKIKEEALLGETKSDPMEECDRQVLVGICDQKKRYNHRNVSALYHEGKKALKGAKKANDASPRIRAIASCTFVSIALICIHAAVLNQIDVPLSNLIHREDGLLCISNHKQTFQSVHFIEFNLSPTSYESPEDEVQMPTDETSNGLWSRSWLNTIVALVIVIFFQRSYLAQVDTQMMVQESDDLKELQGEVNQNCSEESDRPDGRLVKATRQLQSCDESLQVEDLPSPAGEVFKQEERGDNARPCTDSQSQLDQSPTPASSLFNASRLELQHPEQAFLVGTRVGVIKHASDGDCLFSSLAFGWSQLHPNSAPLDPIAVRQELALLVREHCNVVYGGQPLRMWIKDEFPQFTQGGTDGKLDIEGYVNMMLRGAWGGTVEMVLFARVYGVTITVYTEKHSVGGQLLFHPMHVITDQTKTPSQPATVHLLYRSGVHYDSMVDSSDNRSNFNWFSSHGTVGRMLTSQHRVSSGSSNDLVWSDAAKKKRGVLEEKSKVVMPRYTNTKNKNNIAVDPEGASVSRRPQLSATCALKSPVEATEDTSMSAVQARIEAQRQEIDKLRLGREEAMQHGKEIAGRLRATEARLIEVEAALMELKTTSATNSRREETGSARKEEHDEFQRQAHLAKEAQEVSRQALEDKTREFAEVRAHLEAELRTALKQLEEELTAREVALQTVRDKVLVAQRREARRQLALAEEQHAQVIEAQRLEIEELRAGREGAILHSQVVSDALDAAEAQLRETEAFSILLGR